MVQPSVSPAAGSGPITDYSVYAAPGTVTRRATFNTSQSYYHAFINTDGDTATAAAERDRLTDRHRRSGADRIGPPRVGTAAPLLERGEDRRNAVDDAEQPEDGGE